MLEQLRVPAYARDVAAGIARDVPLNEKAMDAPLAGMFPEGKLSPLRRTRIEEAAAIAAYRRQTDAPIVEVLVCDDAPQFKLLAKALGLCWVHDGRHYRKLQPVVPRHATALSEFRERY